MPPEGILRMKDPPILLFSAWDICQCEVTLDMPHLTGCSLLYVHSHVLLVIFWPYGDSVVDPNPCGLPWGEAVVPSASSLSL